MNYSFRTRACRNSRTLQQRFSCLFGASRYIRNSTRILVFVTASCLVSNQTWHIATYVQNKAQKGGVIPTSCAAVKKQRQLSEV